MLLLIWALSNLAGALTLLYTACHLLALAGLSPWLGIITLGSWWINHLFKVVMGFNS